MDTVVVELHDSDELGDMPLAALQRQLGVLRSTRSRVDGQEAAVHSAVRRLRETARRDSKGSSGESEPTGDPGSSDGLPLPDAGPVPEPSRKERNRLDVVVAVGRAGREPGTECPSLVDTLFQYLAFLVLAVIHQLISVLRRIKLSLGRIDTDLPEQSFHTEGPGLIRHDRHDVLTDVLVLHQRRQDANECHRG